jgi:AcrR family transcriptional regulator
LDDVSTAGTDATTQRIRAEALRLFVQRGYGNTTIEHISTAAEVGVATIYRRWSDKAAIANDLYGGGVESMLAILGEQPADDARAEFISIWRRVWNWASANRDLFLFINASAGAPWLTDENVAGKAEVSRSELATYARLRFDAPPDFAAALIGGTIASVLIAEPDIEPDEVAERLWRALTLKAD